MYPLESRGKEKKKKKGGKRRKILSVLSDICFKLGERKWKEYKEKNENNKERWNARGKNGKLEQDI